MISCHLLERPGKWRAVGVGALLIGAALPAVPLLWRVATSLGSVTASLSGAFGSAIQNSLLMALLVAALSFILGLPAGVLTALYEFPGRKVLLALATLPLLVPSFLWAIGFSSLAVRLGPDATHAVSGFSGCLLVFTVGAVPLVLLTSYAASGALSGSQVDAARLSGGERSVVLYASRHAATPALLAAGLGAIFMLSDPGPGQILGLRTAASEILTSFSALYDFTLAGQQCAILTALVLVFAAPLAYFAAPRIANEMMARQIRKVVRLEHAMIAVITSAALAVFVVVGVIMPIAGLTWPVVNGGEFPRALSELVRTGGNTVIYAVGAGATSASLGLLLAFCVGRNDRLRRVCIGVSLALFSLPPMFGALGIVELAADAPAWTDPVLRSRLTVSLALGLRFFPVAVVLGLRAWGSTSASWALAGSIHGVTLGRYLRRVALPLMLPAGATAMLLVALLATADVGTVLLLHPPGEASLPLAIFTVMANAPESFVASLCLVYVIAAGGLLTVIWTLPRRRNAS